MDIDTWVRVRLGRHWYHIRTEQQSSDPRAIYDVHRQRLSRQQVIRQLGLPPDQAWHVLYKLHVADRASGGKAVLDWPGVVRLVAQNLYHVDHPSHGFTSQQLRQRLRGVNYGVVKIHDRPGLVALLTKVLQRSPGWAWRWVRIGYQGGSKVAWHAMKPYVSAPLGRVTAQGVYTCPVMVPLVAGYLLKLERTHGSG